MEVTVCDMNQILRQSERMQALLKARNQNGKKVPKVLKPQVKFDSADFFIQKYSQQESQSKNI